jgi:transposase InsO family protein
MTKYHAGSPMERVHLDFLGPLPETPRGNTNILVMVDQFTKWCEIVPLPSQTAETTAKAAVNEFFARFGCPFSVHTDQGRNFESKLFKVICDLFHIHKTRTTPYRPSPNGQVERYNRTLMDAVRCFVAESQRDWDGYLPQLACAIRSSVNRHTGMTPNKMMLGREINLPSELIFKNVREELFENEEQYVTNLRNNIQKIHEIARKTLKTAQETMKRAMIPK